MKLIFVILISLIFIFSCQESDITSPEETEVGSISLAINMAKAPPGVVSVDGRLSRSDEDTVFIEFEYLGDSAVAIVENLQAGEWNLEVFSYDIDNNITHSGSAIVTVIPGVNIPVVIYLNEVLGGLDITIKWASDTTLIAYYPFSGNANDESGNDNHGTVHGAILTEDRLGNANNAYYFDGVDDYIDIGNANILKPNLPVTIAAWIYLEKNGCILDNNLGDTTYYGLWFNITQGDSTLDVGFGDGGSIGPQSRRNYRAIEAFPKYSWHHVAGIIRGATDMELYIDGNLVIGSYVGTGGPLAYNDDPAEIARHDGSGGGPPDYYGGIIDEIKFYRGALTQSDIQALMD